MYPILTYSRKKGEFPFDLTKLYALGLRALRLIYKGVTEDAFLDRIDELQVLLRKEQLPLDILIDLPGVKPLVGDLDKGMQISAGEEYRLYDELESEARAGLPTRNFFTQKELPQLAPGDLLSFADDELGMEIIAVEGATLICVALNNYLLHSGRSFSIKNKILPVAANAPEDLSMVSRLQDKSGNIKLLPSFIRAKEDLEPLRRLQPDMAIIPKIETVLSDTTLQGILSSCETMMLGRGDLSLNCPGEDLFAYQLKVIDLCRSLEKQCIIATGLLTGISDKSGPTIAAAMDFGFLRSKHIESFFITGTNALYYPAATLAFIARSR